MRAKRILGIMVVLLLLIGLLGACDSRKASDVTSVKRRMPHVRLKRCDEKKMWGKCLKKTYFSYRLGT
ncbi:hypothetical protein [Niallia sp.]|uniref:hypothetical protein n=1 Tax=Niallia sp. TaxID=2837523 RepID=UPI00289DE2D2|nr:hypothetical protein [Niallia sp.]